MGDEPDEPYEPMSAEDALEDAPEVPPVEQWSPGDFHLAPAACPICGSVGTARHMPTHLAEAHPTEMRIHRAAIEAARERKEAYIEEQSFGLAAEAREAERIATVAYDSAHPLGGPGSRETPSEGPMVPDSAKVLVMAQERLTRLFFLMMRDMMPVSQVSHLVELVSQEGDLRGQELETLARQLARQVLGKSVAVRPKHMQEWLEKFPERIRNSPHFNDVMDEYRDDITADERGRSMVMGEVVARQRGERDAGRIVGGGRAPVARDPDRPDVT